jgi:mono/diheme cytochrome c family protein
MAGKRTPIPGEIGVNLAYNRRQTGAFRPLFLQSPCPSMTRRPPRLLPAWPGLLAAGLLAASAQAIDLEQHPGKAIYQKLCLECHGERGEGVDDLGGDPLAGTRSIESLAGRIERTMPEDKAEECVGEDARNVAEYIYHAFYSPAARGDDEPVSPDLARLTGPQIHASVSDLFAAFRRADFPHALEERGLKANYELNNRALAGNNDFQRERFERVDPQVAFDYGAGIPELPEDLETELPQFNINWTGSFYAPETGVYRFTLRTRNGARLFVNDHNTNNPPLVDGWVSAGNDIREEQGSIYLLGGRHYPLRLEFFKHREEYSLIELYWQPPHGTRQIMPAEALSPSWRHLTFVGATEFPADDRSDGYERGISVSRLWLDAVTSLAFEAGDYAKEHLDSLARTKADDEERVEKIRTFAAEFAERALRRPLDETEQQRYVEEPLAQRDEHDTLEDGVRRVVLRALTSPAFLYPAAAFESPDDPWARATKLALAMWDSLPDQRLREAAAKDELADDGQILSQARRMLGDARSRVKLAGFFEHWLELDERPEIAKDTERYPEFDSDLAADLRTSLTLFVDEIVWSEASDYRQLLLADYLYLNDNLAALYGSESPANGVFEKVSLAEEQRTGIITHPYLLSALAYHDNTSPIHRGVFLSRNIAGLPLRPPPEATEFIDSHFSPDLTMREKVTEMTKSASCMACHATINPLGFSLEHFDAIGRWRDKESGRPIDAASVLETDYGDRIEITGPAEVAAFAAESDHAHAVFVQHLFHHVAKQPLLAYGTDTAEELQRSFREKDFHIRELFARIAATAAKPHQSAE